MSEKPSYHFPFSRYPAARIILFFTAGLIYSKYTEIPVLLIVSITISLFALVLLCDLLIKNRVSIELSQFVFVVYMLAIFTSGWSWGAIQLALDYKNSERAAVLQLLEWERAQIVGEVNEIRKNATGRFVWEIQVLETTLGDSITFKEPFRLRGYSDDDYELLFKPGSVVSASVRFIPLSEPRNPHEFHFKKWMERHGYYAQATIVDVNEFIKSSNIVIWPKLRSSLLGLVDRSFSEKTAVLAKALLIGYKHELQQEERTAFARSGLSHIMAVSGLHVGFIVAPFWLFIPFLWKYKWGKWVGLIMLTALLLFYAGITGFSASVSRASLMAWLLTYGKLFHKVRDSVNLMAVAALILLIIEPRQLYDVGFQLSFSAVLIILMILPQAQRLISEKHRQSWVGSFWMIILVSIVVQIGLFPVLTHYFGEFSVIGPIANVLVVPLLSFIVPVSLALLPVSALLPEISGWVFLPAEYGLLWIQWVASTLGNMDGSWLVFEKPSFWVFLIWTAAIALTAALRIPELRWKYLILLLIALNGWQIEKIIQKAKVPLLEMVMLDVGQGDAVYIKTPSGKHLLVDAGRWSPLANSGDQVILPFLRSRGITHLDAVFLSHPHADHIGGMPSIINEMSISKIYQSGYPYESALYLNMLAAAERTGTEIIDLRKGDVAWVDPLIRIFVVGPDGKRHNSNPNDHSLVLKLVYGETAILFTGDAEDHQERRIISRYGDFLKSDILKAGHHGSRTSSTEPFLSVVQPDVVLISLSFRNMFRHPHPEAVNRLQSTGAKIEYTSMEGAIIYRSDGKFLKRHDWR